MTQETSGQTKSCLNKNDGDKKSKEGKKSIKEYFSLFIARLNVKNKKRDFVLNVILF